MFKPDFQSQFIVVFSLSAGVEEHQNTQVGRDWLTTHVRSKATGWARGKSCPVYIFSECDKIDKINERQCHSAATHKMLGIGCGGVVREAERVGIGTRRAPNKISRVFLSPARYLAINLY